MVDATGEDTNPFQFDSGAASSMGDIGKDWGNALSDPSVRTALLQFGISMMQPPSFGDTFASQTGRAIGSAGEALGRNEAADIKQQEADSKQQLRESQSNLAAEKAASQGALTDQKRQALDQQQQKIQLQRQNQTLQNAIRQQAERTRAQAAYQKYSKDTDAANFLLPPDKQQPKVPFEQWYQQSRGMDRTGIGGMPTPPQAAVDRLLNSPETRDQFDAKYGPGASEQYLGAPE